MKQKYKIFYKQLLNSMILLIIFGVISWGTYSKFELNIKPLDLNTQNKPSVFKLELPLIQSTNISHEAIQTTRDPADPHIAVGPENIVVAVNDAFEIYNKSNSDRALYYSTFGSFFSKLLPSNIFIFDPRVIFDHINNRFIMTALARDEIAEESWWLIAASQQSSAIGSWWIHISDATLDDNTPTTNYADFSDVGLDGTHLYLTADMRDFDTREIQYNKVRIFYLAEIYSKFVNTTNDIIDWRNEGDGIVQSLRVVQPLQVVQRYDTGNIMYFINMVESGKLSLWSLEDPMGNYNLTRITVPVGDFIDPPDAEQPDITTRIRINDPRLLEAKLGANGIWTTHTIGYDPGTGDKAAIRLYEIKTDGSEVLNQITLVSTTDYLYYPSLVMDKAGHLILQFSISSANLYASTGYTGRLVTDAPHTINPVVTLIKEGEGVYTKTNRWGDYSGTVIDPTDGHTVWMFNQYATTNNTWSTWVATTTHFKHTVFAPLVFK